MYEMKVGLESIITEKKCILHLNLLSSYNILSVIDYYYQEGIIYNQIINYKISLKSQVLNYSKISILLSI